VTSEKEGFTVKKVLAFVLTFGLVCAMTTTIGCGKKDADKPAATDKDKAPADKKDKEK
jgi:hypothetical protein